MSLKIENLTKQFDKKNLFKNFSYQFNRSGIVALVGESGNGKTTMLRMIAGLDKKYKGEISGGGFSNVSFMFQEYRLFPQLSALDNVIFANYDTPTQEQRLEAKEILLRLGFSENDVKLLPSELSGGMKQRVSFARAILKKTPVLLLDEPTKELDSKHREFVHNIISEQAKERLVIIVSHNDEDITYLNAEKIFVGIEKP